MVVRPLKEGDVNLEIINQKDLNKNKKIYILEEDLAYKEGGSRFPSVVNFGSKVS